jgi:hypothetical protein
MKRSARLAPLAGVIAGVALACVGVLVPFEVRHSAPFGFRLTFDARRGIAVTGSLITANYPNFERVDLDLRAYGLAPDVDVTVHVQPVDPSRPGDVRTVPLTLPFTRVDHQKSAFADPFVTVRFPPIADAAGHRYYVWVEPGPRHQDDILALWSLKSYSRVTGREVLAAFLADPPGNRGAGAVRATLIAVMIGVVVTFGWLIGALVASTRTQRLILAPPESMTAVFDEEDGSRDRLMPPGMATPGEISWPDSPFALPTRTSDPPPD